MTLAIVSSLMGLAALTLPTATPAQVGWVTIASTPMGASVTMDGKALGVTPVAGIEISSGTSHSV